MSSSTCSHQKYIEITGQTGDGCHIVLRQQPDIVTHPLEDRPQTDEDPDYQDLCVAETYDSYPPRVKGLGDCDCLTFRVCIDCHVVIGMEKLSEQEWMQELTREGRPSDKSQKDEDDDEEM
jgi:hypothetical protein